MIVGKFVRPYYKFFFKVLTYLGYNRQQEIDNINYLPLGFPENETDTGKEAILQVSQLAEWRGQD